MHMLRKKLHPLPLHDNALPILRPLPHMLHLQMGASQQPRLRRRRKLARGRREGGTQRMTQNKNTIGGPTKCTCCEEDPFPCNSTTERCPECSKCNGCCRCNWSRPPGMQCTYHTEAGERCLYVLSPTDCLGCTRCPDHCRCGYRPNTARRSIDYDREEGDHHVETQD